MINMIKIISILIIAHVATCSYIVTWDCGRCTNSALGTNCFSFQGGPFTTYYQQSIDSKYQSCAESNLTFPTIFTFNCSSACSDCSININTKGISFTVCSQDSNGQIMTQLLDIYYKDYKNDVRITYDWCGDLNCVSGSLSIGVIIGIVAGAIVVVAVGVVGFMFWKKRSRMRGAGQTVRQNPYSNGQSFRRSQQRRDSLIRSACLAAEQGPLLR